MAKDNRSKQNGCNWTVLEALFPANCSVDNLIPGHRMPSNPALLALTQAICKAEMSSEPVSHFLL